MALGISPWLLFCLVFCYAQSIEISLQPDTLCSNGTHNVNSSTPGDCESLDMVLEGMQSNTTLVLSRGNYTVRTNYSVINKSDVRIIGNPEDPGSVIIECDDSFGLVFISIQRLHITGLTIRDCGFKGADRVQELFSYLKTFIFLIFTPLADFSTGIFLAYCQDSIIEDVSIEENEGFGLVGINIVGDSRFSRVNLISNNPMECIKSLDNATQPGGSGGAMFLLFQDFVKDFEVDFNNVSNFIFEHGHIEGNYNCRLDLFAVQYNKLSRSLEPVLSQDNSIIGAGGVTISLGQSAYQVNATFTDCNVTGNSGLYHTGGMEITQFEITSDTHVYVKNTIFYKNGGRFFGRPEYGTHSLDPGGALVAAFYAPIPNYLLNSKTLGLLILQEQSSVELINCTFRENIAQSGSGVSVVSFGPVIGFIQDFMNIQNCTFVENEGDYGSALFITEISYSAFEPGLIIYIDSIEVAGNKRLASSTSDSFRVDGTSVVDINYVNVSLTGSNVFHSNQDTALAIYNGILTLSGSANFSFNVGSTGGALHLESESYLVLAGEAKILFQANRGHVYGGAIYVDFNTVRSNRYDCFLFIDRVDIFCNIFNRCPAPDNRFNVSFIDNTAPFGRAIFGSTFSSCPWNLNNEGLQFLTINDTANGTWISPDRSRLPLFFDPPFDINDNNKTINTVAETILWNAPTESNDTSSVVTVEVTPGQMFETPLGAFDQLNQPIPLTIFSQLESNNDQVHSHIAESNRFLLSGGQQEFFNVPIHVFGEQNVTYNVTISSNEALVDLNIIVHLTNCSDGFVFNNETFTCDCEIMDFLDDVMCTNNGLIMYPEDNWIGRDENDNYIQAECILDFCKPGVSRLNFSERDSQCTNGRSGILCGQCAEGYSRKIGSTVCGPCKDSYGLLLILLFAALGITLFVVLALFNITITDGYINGFIFYANIVGVYTATFLPDTDAASAGYLPRVLIAFLNLNFGIETCFYTGATELSLAGLRLLFPVYLMLILLMVTLCGKYITHKRVSSLLQKINVTHIFATLILYSYTSVTQTCIALLGSVTVDGASLQPVRWLRDPNVLYTSELHIFLVILSVIFLIIFVPVTILLLIPKISYRVPHVNELKPLIDAFIAPFAAGKTFWISFRLLFRLVIFVIAAFGVSTAQLVAMACLIALLTILQAYIKPFRTASRNFVDMLVMVNLTVFSIVTIFLHPQIVTNVSEVMIVLSLFAYIFTAMLLLLFLHYLLIRFTCTRVYYLKTVYFIKQKLSVFGETLDQLPQKRTKRESTEDVANLDLDVAATHTSVELSPRASRFEETGFIALREVLLEEPSTGRSSNKSTRRTGDSTS